jgi:hypothetical protein
MDPVGREGCATRRISVNVLRLPRRSGAAAKAGVVLTMLALSAATTAYAQSAKFTPPRLLKARLSELPPPTVAGGGEVLIEAIVDRTGKLTRPMFLRGTAPYVQIVLDAVATWQFEPAREVDYQGLEATVEMPVTILAIYRPPVLMNTPTIGEPPKDLMKPSGDAAMATVTVAPLYPPDTRDGGVALFEIALDEGGRVTETRDVASTRGFESAARAALVQFRFRAGSHRARPVPATTYVLLGFRPPVFTPLGQVPQMPPTSGPPFPPGFTPPPPADFKPPPPADFKPPPAPDFRPPPAPKP